MESSGDLARRWRDHAAKIRSAAAAMDHSTAATDLHGVADRWEAKAKAAEERAAVQAAAPSS